MPGTGDNSWTELSLPIIGLADEVPQRPGEETSQVGSNLAEASMWMNMRPTSHPKPRLLRITASEMAIERLPALLRAHQPAAVYVAFDGHPEIARSRELIGVVLNYLREANCVAPHPIFVGLAEVAADWQDTFQRALIMEGVGGFCREDARRFADDYSAELIDVDAAVPASRSEEQTSWVSAAAPPAQRGRWK